MKDGVTNRGEKIGCRFFVTPSGACQVTEWRRVLVMLRVGENKPRRRCGEERLAKVDFL